MQIPALTTQRADILPLFYNFQGEVQKFPFALLPPFDHLQDGDGSAQVSAQLQHLLIGRFIVLAILKTHPPQFPSRKQTGSPKLQI